MEELEHTKFKITKLIGATHLLSFLGRDDGASHHHRSNTNHNHTTKLLRINGYDDTNVFTIDVQPEISADKKQSLRGANRHRIDRIILSLNHFWLAKNPVHRNMKTMIILRRQSEYTQGATFEFGCIVLISWTEKPLHGEISSLDPNLCGFLNFVEDHAATIGRGDHNVRIIWRCAWTGIWFKFSIEEFIESSVNIGIKGQYVLYSSMGRRTSVMSSW